MKAFQRAVHLVAMMAAKKAETMAVSTVEVMVAWKVSHWVVRKEMTWDARQAVLMVEKTVDPKEQQLVVVTEKKKVECSVASSVDYSECLKVE
jgi:hypothetical protein